MTLSLRLVDTNVVSYLMRVGPLGDQYSEILGNHPRSISFMTVAELYEGADRANWASKRLMFLEQEIRKYILHPWTPDICHLWAHIRTERRRQPISPQDAFIAATALAHSCPLVTHNVADFHAISGLKLITAT